MFETIRSLMLLLLCSQLLHSQQKEVTIKTIKLSSDVYMLTGKGGNIGIYKGLDYTLMIDDQFADVSKKIQASIKSITNKPIAFLVNTHMHGDHTGGNTNFNNKATTIVAHKNVRTTLKRQNKQPSSYPELTFSDNITFYEGKESIMIFHVHQAHTDGDAIVYFTNNNVLHMGDTYFSNGYPYIDIKSGGSIQGYIKAQKTALAMTNEDTKIIPGHGDLSNKNRLRGNIEMLENITKNIQNEINKGSSKEEIINNQRLTKKYDTQYGNGYINPTKIRTSIYNSLTASK